MPRNRKESPDPSRRKFLYLVGGTTLAGAVMWLTAPRGVTGPVRPTDTPHGQTSQNPSTQETLSWEEKVRREVTRLTTTYYNKGSIEHAIYLEGEIPGLSSIYKLPADVGITTIPREMASIKFSVTYDQTKRLFYRPFSEDNAGAANPTPASETTPSIEMVTSIKPTIYFSANFLDMKSDMAKRIIMVKEEMQIAVLDRFTRISYNSYIRNGKVESSDPSATDEQKRLTLGLFHMAQTPGFLRMLDFAGYLYVLSQLDYLLQNPPDPFFKEDMAKTNAIQVLERAKAAGIQYRFTPDNFADEFYPLALDYTSPWRKLIEDPSLEVNPEMILNMNVQPTVVGGVRVKGAKP